MTKLKRRPPEDDDQANAEKAYRLIQELKEINPGIEPSVWVGGCWTALINCYKASGFDYEDFCKEVEKVKKFYKDKFRE